MFSFHIIKQVLSLSIATSTTLEELVKVVEKVKDVGMAPLIEKKTLLRDWLRDTIILMGETGTSIKIEGRVTQVLEQILDSESAWNLAYKYIVELSGVSTPKMASDLSDLDVGEQHLAGNIAKTVNRELNREHYYRDTDQTPLDSSIVIIIMREVVEVLRMWRNE